ncbi:PH domain-containing protein [Silanimonas algicola]
MAEPHGTPDRDDREALQAVATHRLHPLSWLFTLIAQLRMFALPLLVLLLGGSREEGDDIGDLIGLAGAAALAVVAVWQYFTYRYGFLEAALVVRSGLLQRNVRLIPFDRVQNVTLHQNLLHRLVGVAEVRLESAGGMGQAEAQMQVLKLDQAHALEALVRAGAPRARAAPGADMRAAPVDGEEDRAPILWLELPTRELVRLGLISNRGMLVVAAGFAYLTQAGDALTKRLSNGIESVGREGIAFAEAWHLGPAAYVALALALLLAMVIAVRLLSVALAILQFHDFRLYAGERELRVERGLLSRVRTHLPKRRIQAYSLRETLLHRWFGRQSLRVDRAAIETVNESQSVRDLVPLATPNGMDGMLAALLPDRGWPLADWQPLHARAWWRVFAPLATVVLAGTAVLIYFEGAAGLWALSLLGLLFLRARVWARYSAWTLEGGVIAFRQGWLDRHWRFAEARKLHALQVTQSPFDRRHGMATLHLDTAGASPMEPPLRIPYLALADAEALAERLRSLMPRDAGINPARTGASAARAG